MNWMRESEMNHSDNLSRSDLVVLFTMNDSLSLTEMQHRFYGKSIPYGGNKKIAYSNSSTLGYLSSTQALADYATLIIDLKKNLSATDSPVVVLGGSYGGSIYIYIYIF